MWAHARRLCKHQRADLVVALRAACSISRLRPLGRPSTPDGWVISIPGAHPIATPAYADGLLFVGGGWVRTNDTHPSRQRTANNRTGSYDFDKSAIYVGLNLELAA